MSLPKGGRGCRAPYDTCVLRIPVAIKAKVEKISEDYRLAVIAGEEFVCGDRVERVDDAIVISKKLLEDKKMSKKTTIAKLLQAIYQLDISLTDIEKMLDKITCN